MKTKPIKLAVSMILVLIVSCNDPETVVTNYVHRDGSVTRKIVMKSPEGDVKKRFNIPDLQVPFDHTWTIRDSSEVSPKGDTTWVKRAEKTFKNTDEINICYKADSGINKIASRHSDFNRKFRWFNTVYRFSEKIDRKLSSGYPVKEFLNNEELQYFYSPEELKQIKENGSDSLKFRALADSVKRKTDIWTVKNITSDWINEFSILTKGKSGNDFTGESLKTLEDEFMKILQDSENKFDSLWAAGVLLERFIGVANSIKYKAEADTAMNHVIKNILIDFKDYSVRIVMPGKLIGTNGFIDSSQILLWPVKSDYFLTQQYEMWAESKDSNAWAWIVSVIFLLFVLAGVIIRIIKKD